jgi:hypothetical protein
LFTPPLRTRASSTPPGVIKSSDIFKQEVISEEAIKIEAQRKELELKKQEIQDKRKQIELDKLLVTSPITNNNRRRTEMK